MERGDPVAFGYEILHGRQGVTGHCRDTEGKTVVQARGFQPGERCVLYALMNGSAEMRDEQTADGNGQAVLTGMGGGPVFVASGGKVLLWQGGEENYLRACEWMKRGQKKTGETQNDASPEHDGKQPETTTVQPEDARNILARDLEEIQMEPVKPESVLDVPETEEKSAPPASETPYTLRPAGTGEPVDALPD